MMPLRTTFAWTLASLLLTTTACDSNLPTDAPDEHASFAPGGGGPPGGETAGNNLSYPVIWAENVPKALPGIYAVADLGGEWWYSWGTTGTDPNVTPLSCPPDPDDMTYCDDGLPGTVGDVPGVGGNMDLVRAYLQKDLLSSWQAESGSPADLGVAQVGGELFVDWIDWGDNLESVDWYTRSQVRTEVVLFQDNPDPVGNPWLEYAMRHTSGWGIDEVHGAAATLQEPVAALYGPGDRATIFSPCARFTIQLLLAERDDPRLADLVWVPGEGWGEPAEYPDDLIHPPIFNEVVYEAGDGPGYYNAEINVKGRIIFGYTWNVRKLHDAALNAKGAGDYRLTFSFDESCGTADLNTFFVAGYTEILVPLEEELLVAAAEEGEEPGGGGTAVLDYANNLTYMDVSILERGGGGGGGGNGGGGGGGPPPGQRGNH